MIEPKQPVPRPAWERREDGKRLGRGAAALWLAAWALGALLAGAAPAPAKISTSQPLEIRILLDNSGSMYPGYTPGSGRRRSQLGVKFFYQYPRFRAWLGDFVAQQKLLNGRSISMAVLTSTDRFKPGDVKEVQPRVALGQFDVESALRQDKIPDFGGNTFLTEGLDSYTRGFEGLVWLITDNIVETGDGNPDAGVVSFFETLKTTPRFRSVHLFKLPFEDKGFKSHLAVYGILVSRDKISGAKYFDRKFREDFRLARRPPGAPTPALFPKQEHLKLKDLSVDALRLQIPDPLDVDLQDRRRSFRERQNVPLKIPGVIESNLTHHWIIGGSYTLSFITSFLPDKNARDNYGIQPIPPEAFTTVTRSLDERVPPQGSLTIDVVELDSKERVTLEPASFWAWIKMAALGLRVEYSGTVRMSFDGLRVKLDRQKMSGIFGVDKASKVFESQDILQIKVEPEEAPIRFALASAGYRGFLLLLLLLLLGAPLAYTVFSLQRTANYRVTVGTEPPTVVALRRLGRYRIFHSPHTVGSLVRGFDGRHRFVPNPDLREVHPVSTSRPGSYSVSLPDGQGLSFSIETLEAGPKAARGSHRGIRRPSAATLSPASGAVPAPARRGPGKSPKPAPPGKRKPRIRRPGR